MEEQKLGKIVIERDNGQGKGIFFLILGKLREDPVGLYHIPSAQRILQLKLVEILAEANVFFYQCRMRWAEGMW